MKRCSEKEHQYAPNTADPVNINALPSMGEASTLLRATANH